MSAAQVRKMKWVTEKIPSTEAVDNSVDKPVTVFSSADISGAAVKLAVFSPLQNSLIFQLVKYCSMCLTVCDTLS
ncbi:hypothetical protein [Stutzerimonas nitrititolerans]|uniref:hypothetical protein n=1 Tax=Stutzerimonas nitrititolerans TaxID=2482751 RepID=UPI0028A817D6|nr:hypothetical protein [Stutzerimonas nitrititolerans]